MESPPLSNGNQWTSGFYLPNLRLIAFPLPSQPIVSLTVIRRGGWLTLGDDREFTHSRLASRRRIWHWTTAWLFLGDDLFTSFYHLSFSFPSWGNSPRGDNLFSTWWRGGESGVQKYRGLTHAVESSGPYAGPAARHMFARLHYIGSASSTKSNFNR